MRLKEESGFIDKKEKTENKWNKQNQRKNGAN